MDIIIKAIRKSVYTELNQQKKEFQITILINTSQKEKTVLDIGSNAGFMACFLSEFTKEVDAIELNPYLVKMGSVTKAFLGLKNVNFLEGDFTEYSFPQ